MNYLIEFSNQQESLHLNEDILREVAERLLTEEQVQKAEISIAVVTHLQMRTLNRQYLDHDYTTDVLSFLLNADVDSPQKSELLQTAKLRGAGKIIEGQLILCSDMAADMAEKYGWKPENELMLYLVHGMLHLLGYDDLSEAEHQIMRNRERAILGIWNLQPQYDDRIDTPDEHQQNSSQGVSGEIV